MNNMELKVACQKELRKTGRPVNDAVFSLIGKLQGDVIQR
jgi:hypothetical protein